MKQNIIAIVFDFDDTLAAESVSSFLTSRGVDVEMFWSRSVAPLVDDNWDPVPAYLYRMIELSHSNTYGSITREKLAQWGNHIDLFAGAEEIFERLRNYASHISPHVELEFYLISSGVGEIVRNTKIARNFKEIWASEFLYDEEGAIIFPKRIVNFTDKTRYLFHISKGIIGNDAYGKPFEVNMKVESHNIRIPLKHMIMVGDGYTDIPCFSLVKKYGGIAIGVYDNNDQEKSQKAQKFIEDERVHHLVAADYTEGSELSLALENAINLLVSEAKRSGS